MPLITFAVPCYNSQDYMSHCLGTLLTAKRRAEILIIDDGSTDDTAEIADRFEEENKGYVRAVHQPNKGHGGAVNTGLYLAQGTFFKVVDSDDWLDPAGLQRVLDVLEKLSGSPETTPDLFITDFLYDKAGEHHKKKMSFKGVLPQGEIFSWDRVKRMRIGKYILMHSVIYRTECLRQSGLKLPEHTFYVDNLFVYEPLPAVKKIYYMDVLVYHYFIGRTDQSVNEEVMKKRIDQQLRVNRLMIDDLAGKKGTIDESCRQYMFHYLNTIMMTSSTLLIMINTDEADRKMEELWHYLEEKDPDLYDLARYHDLAGKAVHMNKHLVRVLYRLAQKLYGFN